jgi:hypothetical protein
MDAETKLVIEQLKSRIAALEQKNTEAVFASELVSSLGDLDYRAIDDNGALIMIMSAVNLLEEFGIDAHLAGFDPATQTAQVYINATTGKITAGGGAITLGNEGVVITGLSRLLKFVATYGSYTGEAYIRMKVSELTGKPVLSITAEEPTSASELVVDGGFESGALSPNWTTATDVSVVSAPSLSGANPSAPHGGSYMVEFLSAGTNRSIEAATRVAITAGSVYQLKAYAAGNGTSGSQIGVQLFIDWYDAATSGTLVQSDFVDRYLTESGGALGNGWVEIGGAKVAPVGATHAVYRILFGDASGTGKYAWLDDISMKLASGLGEIAIDPEIAFRGANTRFDEIVSEPSRPAAGSRVWATLKSSLLKIKNRMHGQPALVGAGFARMAERDGRGFTSSNAGSFVGIGTDIISLGTASWTGMYANRGGMYHSFTATASCGYGWPSNTIGFSSSDLNVFFAAVFSPDNVELANMGGNFGLVTATPTAAPPGSGMYCVIYYAAGGGFYGKCNIGSSTLTTSLLVTPVTTHVYLLSWDFNALAKTVTFNVYDMTTDELYTETVTLTGSMSLPTSRFIAQFIRTTGTIAGKLYRGYSEFYTDEL